MNGSQQCLDLFAKIFLNTGDHFGMERPGYLGAIEAFSLYEPVIDTVPLEEDGPDLAAFERLIQGTTVKFFYGIPNSQNPSGLTYSQEKHRAIAEIIRESDTVFYEDDAFGELFFDGSPGSGKTARASPGCIHRFILKNHRAGYAYRLDTRTRHDSRTV